jgi:hypothetical protein
MTPEEKRSKKAERDAEICTYYLSGAKLSRCASRFRLGRQRVLQILQKAGVWKPYVKSTRTAFLGVKIEGGIKEQLKQEADRQGISVSQLVSSKLQQDGER